jgi:HAD superfamily hydrolase (TIGR01509 family)
MLKGNLKVKIKNIILDLGGVIIDIDYNKTSTAFKKLGAKNFDAIYSQQKQSELFDHYETGKIECSEFRARLKQLLNIENISDAEFDNAWNAMLGDIPPERLAFLKQLKTKGYNLYLFSNTNAIHLTQVNNALQKSCLYESLAPYFMECYYSHIFGQRKPHTEAFQKILKIHGLQASKTVFVDDSKQHIEGAKEAGLNVIHLTPEKSLINLDDYIRQLVMADEKVAEQEESTRAFSPV